MALGCCPSPAAGVLEHSGSTCCSHFAHTGSCLPWKLYETLLEGWLCHCGHGRVPSVPLVCGGKELLLLHLWVPLAGLFSLHLDGLHPIINPAFCQSYFCSGSLADPRRAVLDLVPKWAQMWVELKSYQFRCMQGYFPKDVSSGKKGNGEAALFISVVFEFSSVDMGWMSVPG